MQRVYLQYHGTFDASVWREIVRGLYGLDALAHNQGDDEIRDSYQYVHGGTGTL